MALGTGVNPCSRTPHNACRIFDRIVRLLGTTVNAIRRNMMSSTTDRAEIEALFQPFRLPDVVALRRAARARVPAPSRRCSRRARGRGDRASRFQACPRRPVAARDRHLGVIPVKTDEGKGQPSRWNTLRVLRVLNWYSARV
jgi:hypothetical protein